MPETTMAYPSVPRARNINDPIEPTGNKLLSGVGPAAWAERADRPDLTIHGEPKIVPMRTAPEFFVEPRDPDPRRYDVVGCDGAVAGSVAELWVDKSEPQVRYLECSLPRRERVLHPSPGCVEWRSGRESITGASCGRAARRRR
jgi:hypothetical protein